MTDGDRTLTADDMVVLDRATLARFGRWASVAAWVLITIGVLGTLAWLWVAYRTQDLSGDTFASAAFTEEPGLPWRDRLTLFSSQLGLLVESGVLVGVGLLLRLLVDHVLLAQGLSPAGHEVGDPWPLEDEDDLDRLEDPDEPS